MSHRALAPAVLALLLLTACAGAVDRMREGAVRKVTPGVAFEILRDNRDILVIDLRTEAEHEGPLGHIAGSINVPLAELPALLDKLEGAGNRALLLYCRAGDDCGERGVAVLHEHGFDYPFLLDGGLEAWVDAGFGTVDATASSTDGD